jgi:hypothetical protein
MRQVTLLIILILLPLYLHSQQQSSTASLPSGYRSITLGSSPDAVKEALSNDNYFYYRGEPDVSMLDKPDNSGFEVRGVGFIKRAFFLFYEERLYSITLELNENFIDYFNIYSALREKYGEPTDIDPRRAYWNNDSVELSVEKPLYVKYIDRTILEQIKENFSIEENMQTMRRDDFLNQL